jgi:triosephosphate isomerase
VVKRQLSAVIQKLAHCVGEMVVAYEPVWAIGTGRRPRPSRPGGACRAAGAAEGGHAAGDAMVLLYGGSVKPDNAASLLAQADIDGGLIGGAALKAGDFWRSAGLRAERRRRRTSQSLE